MLNALGVQGFNGFSIIEFNKPEVYWDGTEMLAYSYRLNTSRHPGFDYATDIVALQESPVLVGANDEAIDAEPLRVLFDRDLRSTEVEALDGVDHFGVFTERIALDRIARWLGAR